MSPVTLTFPADSVNVALARTVAAAMAARADLTIDRLEDARLAVDEAVAQLLPGAGPESTITCAFISEPGTLRISVDGTWNGSQPPSTRTFGWTVLTALCTAVDARVDDGTLSLTLLVEGAVPASA
jgi:serine/threonine-protein kinase RsbW